MKPDARRRVHLNSSTDIKLFQGLAAVMVSSKHVKKLFIIQLLNYLLRLRFKLQWESLLFMFINTENHVKTTEENFKGSSEIQYPCTDIEITLKHQFIQKQLFLFIKS